METTFICHYCGHNFKKWIYRFSSDEEIRCPNGNCNTRMTEANARVPGVKGWDTDPFGYNKTKAEPDAYVRRKA